MLKHKTFAELLDAEVMKAMPIDFPNEIFEALDPAILKENLGELMQKEIFHIPGAGPEDILLERLAEDPILWRLWWAAIRIKAFSKKMMRVYPVGKLAAMKDVHDGFMVLFWGLVGMKHFQHSHFKMVNLTIEGADPDLALAVGSEKDDPDDLPESLKSLLRGMRELKGLRTKIANIMPGTGKEQ